jgi:UDP-N-acetylmuramoyl-tripeptide--D-alanyl-D-alanine ligase
MISLNLGEVAEYVGGSLQAHASPLAQVTGEVRIDSREVQPGDLFVAIQGDTFDGHDFVEQALASGAIGVISAREVGVPHIRVEDTVRALGSLARGVLTRLPGLTVVALTGSSGKTSTKDLLAQVLPMLGPTVAPQGSFNNETGLPLTALGVDQQTRFLVAEMGARGIGHIGYLCQITPPKIAIVLNVGSAHVGEFGSRAAIAIAKGELVESLGDDGVAILNEDDEFVRSMRSRTQARVLTFGRSETADVRITDVTLSAQGNPSFTVTADGESARIELPLVGEHHVSNAAAVVAVGVALGVPVAELAAALSQVRALSRWRMEVTTTAGNVTLINDAYNANPESVAAALRALIVISGSKSAELSATRRSFAVLGEMRELGESSQAAHEEIGRLTVELGVEQVVVVGAAAVAIADARSAAGMSEGTRLVDSPQAAVDVLSTMLRSEDVVLVKASRAVGLEAVAAGIAGLST